MDFLHLLQRIPLLFITWKDFPEHPLHVVGGFEIIGLPKRFFQKSCFSVLIHPEDRWATKRERHIFWENKKTQGVFRYRLNTKPVIWVEEWVIYDPRGKRYQSAILDITFWKEQEREFLCAQKLDQDFLEASPVALWEEDFSALKFYVDGLKKQGIKDLESYFDAHRREVIAVVGRLQITRVNAKALKLSGARSKEEFFEKFSHLIRSDYSFEKYKCYLLAVARGESSYEWEEKRKNLQGEIVHIHFQWQVIPGWEDTFQRVVVIALDITGRKTTEDLMLYRATHDSLTGLLNRMAFREEVERLCADPRQGRKKFALFFLDLDGFKKVNDLLGHQVGDELLRLFAHRLKKVVRQTDLLARVGGDEFVLLQKEISCSQDTDRMERLLQEIMEEDFVVGNHRIRLSLSVGKALCPDDARNPNKLMSIADSRMYQSKGTKAKEELETT